MSGGAEDALLLLSGCKEGCRGLWSANTSILILRKAEKHLSKFLRPFWSQFSKIETSKIKIL